MPGVPFLCNFVDKVDDTTNRDYSTDIRDFLTEKLKLPKNKRHSRKCVLILSRSLDLETDIVCIELLRRGIDYVRLNAEEITHRLTVANSIEQDSFPQCEIKLGSRLINLSDISAVWLRHFDYCLIQSNNNDLYTAFIFQQWNDALQILYGRIENKWINSLHATTMTNNRIAQLTYARRAGFKIPSTLITNDPQRARSFYRDHNGDIILKALHHHDIEVNKKIYSIYSHRMNSEDLLNIADLIYAPCILQERIPNYSELRVTVIQDKVFISKLGSEISALSCNDIHRIPLSKLPQKSIELGSDLNKRCIRFIKSLGLKYGAIDFVMDMDEELFFLEVNPSGDWLWIERQTKLPITRHVVDLIEGTAKGSNPI